jgi:hypothetical protein
MVSKIKQFLDKYKHGIKFLWLITLIAVVATLFTMICMIWLDFQNYPYPLHLMKFHHWDDGTLIRYIIGWWIAALGVVLFLWWWVKAKNPSFVYGIVTLWFTGEMIEKGIQIYARSLRLYSGSTTWTDSSLLWEAKGDVSIVAQAIMIVYLTRRIYKTYIDGITDMRRRVNEKA